MKKLVSLLGSLAFVAIMAYSMRPFYMGYVRAWLWDGTSTFVCDGNENLSMSNKTADITGGVAFDIRVNCQITCEACTLKGEVGVRAGDNAQVTLVGGTVEGTDAAFEMSSNASFEATDTIIKGPIGIDASTGGNGTFTLRGVTLEATKRAIDVSGNSKVVARKSILKAPVGITAGSNAQVTLRGGSLEATGLALEQKSNAKIIIKDGAKVVGQVKAQRPANIEGMPAGS